MKAPFVKKNFHAWNLEVVWCGHQWPAGWLIVHKIWLCWNQCKTAIDFKRSEFDPQYIYLHYFLPILLFLVCRHGELVENSDMIETPLPIWQGVSSCHCRKTYLEFCLALWKAFRFFLPVLLQLSGLNSCMNDRSDYFQCSVFVI